jgi:pimeloyl-ACP methyl ester carboxylesterase
MALDTSRRSLLAGAAGMICAAAAPEGWTDHAFTAGDGVIIHYSRRGAGDGVVILHGAFDAPQTWFPVADRLASRFTFYVLRRRGWVDPPPDDGTASFAREKADIARLLAIAGPRAALFGHSAGGALAADYARSHVLPGRLILFDPALPLGGPVTGELLGVMRGLVGDGRQGEAFRLFLQNTVHIDPADIDAFAATPEWRRQAALMHNGLRELAAIDALPSDPRAYASIAAPTWLIEGELSPEHPFHDAARALASVLPHVRVRVLEGQGHMGMADAPGAFAEILGACLAAPVAA